MNSKRILFRFAIWTPSRRHLHFRLESTHRQETSLLASFHHCLFPLIWFSVTWSPVSRLPIPGTLFLFHPQVYAVVVSHEQTSGDLSPAAVSYTSGFYSIPVIGISSRDAAFSDKNIHVSFLRTVPPYYHQADVWLEMLSHFAYTKVRSRVTHP